MKKFVFLFLFVIGIFSADAIKYELEETFSKDKVFMLYNFDDKSLKNSLYGISGVLNFDEYDREARCLLDFVDDSDLHYGGSHLRITYDVNSSKPAFNGWWIKLMYADYRKLKALSVAIKGDASYGFSECFKIELKDKEGRMIEALIEGINGDWQTFLIPFEDFTGAVDAFDWYNMNELVFVFEDWRFSTKEGRYFVDDIAFLTQENKTPTFGEISKRSSFRSDEDYYAEVMEKAKSIQKQESIEIKVNEDKSIGLTLKNIQFEANKARLLPESKQTLNLIAETLNNFSDKKITIVGHTANVGDSKIQLSLSIARAKAVYDYLLTKINFNPKNISYTGKGGTQPIAPNNKEEYMKKNRRVEILLQ